ncbi:serine/threonine protein kinase [Streptomyces puniciscabiei]|uniref:Serine/threonine protein kinase n=2 Tax=Streptomyces puniciscabiei TaxID=164348 RepID=A0A542UDV2_9ACTN|nr:serine/threonine-protein kinase [Streptomyces puniciscabiei]TQK97255.1 serine/threonine protein kinase [Streptomyces puniciscabiei]
MQPLEVDEPATVGPYRLLGRLGSGGMGRVYLGRSAGGRTVAVKIVHPHFALDEEFRARFRREVAAARRVGGAWTAPVLDADPDAPVPWVATAYAAGPSLAAAVTDTGPLPPHTVRALGAGLAEALTAVHELGLVHRDVKPSNVLLTLDGPLLIDFGIARAMDGTASLTSTGVSIGSPGYMAPEQILGKGATGAADVFSLGAVLVHAATGEPPFRGDSSAALLYKVVHEEPELGALDGDLRELVASCLAKDPASRPTPADLGHRLAPDGAARLITGGWLPGPLVEQVSRSAVRLLNLDTGETAPSGPVAFDSPAVTASSAGTPVSGHVPGTGAGAASGLWPASGVAPVQGSASIPAPAEPNSLTGAGVFGPAPVMNPGVPGPSSGTATGVDGAPPGAPTVVPAQRDAAPPGRFSVSVAAASAPAEGGRGRRLSCTLVLAVAGALAAGTLGVGALLRPWFQDGGSSSAGGSAPSISQTPPSASNGAGDQGTGAGTVPARYLGTWEGQATGLGGSLPMGTFRLTVRQAAVGQELGRLRQTDQIGGVCTDVLTLKKVTKTQILATSTGAKDNPGHCVPTPHQVELTPVGDDLRFTSDSSAEGNPVSRMSKVG